MGVEAPGEGEDSNGDVSNREGATGGGIAAEDLGAASKGDESNRDGGSGGGGGGGTAA
jgi:hypothetical protein